MKRFRFYDKQQVLAYTKIRRFETKLGERIRCISPASNLEEALQQPSIKYVLFGVPEDIGVKANNGMGGADSAWHPFLQSFLNTQSNDFLDGNEVLLLGHFDFSDVASLIDNNADNFEEKLAAYRHAVNMIDDEVEQLMHMITQNRKMPIVIGGGHNNAYPCIKGAAKGWYKAGVIELAQINVMNLDAHADYRPMEGRHSGNAFRYAEEDGYLEKYCVLGLHENYIQQNVWMDIVNNPFMDCITYEDIFLHEKRTFTQAIAHAVDFTDDTLVGIELDVDCIEHTLSSAATPVGIIVNHARQYVHFATAQSKPAYLHICEGATRLSDGRTDVSTGKLISYLVSDFLKAMAI
jgi:formiminoglutamase